MSLDYEYDIFISYRHKGPAFSWVTEYFYPMLEQWLPEHVPVTYEPRIFIDSQIETGAEWPAKLRHALKTSRCVLPVLSPEYFRSRWCCAEFESIKKREELLSLRNEQNPGGLIYAVVFASPGLLPDEVRKHIQYKDLSSWATNQANFRESKRFESFENEVKLICQELWKMIQLAPPWREWPIIAPEEVLPAIPVSLPRLP
jgi:hypothetical protein